MKSQKFCCELNVRYESMIDDLQDRVKDLKQKQKDAYLLELDMRGKIIDLEKERNNIKALYESHGKNMKQALDENVKLHGRIAELERERDEWKHWGSNCEAELADKRSAWAEQGLNLANAQNDLDSLLEVEAAARNLIVCGQYSTSAFEKLERLVK